jgi:hypothetical protein
MQSGSPRGGVRRRERERAGEQKQKQKPKVLYLLGNAKRILHCTVYFLLSCRILMDE